MSVLGRECKKTPKAIKKPTIRDIEWIAGFLEGEGSFNSGTSSEMIVAGQVQRWPLERLQAFLGGTIHPYKSRHPNWKPSWVWTVSGSRARGIMMTVFSLMSPKRKDEIKRALSLRSSLLSAVK